jgi:hypothetical protein
MHLVANSQARIADVQIAPMTTAAIFQLQLVSGYVAWGLCFGTYVVPWLRSLGRDEAFRAMATLHGFRFFGLAFLVPGVVGSGLPENFATFAALGDLATGVLAMLALATFRIRPLFWTFVVAFNGVGVSDLLFDYAHAMQVHLPEHAGQLGGMYAVPVLYVPALMISHGLAFYWLLRGRPAFVLARQRA